MTEIVDVPTKTRMSLGQKPLRFYINAMGEYGHFWPNPTGDRPEETMGGTINLAEMAKETGKKMDDLTAADFERYEQRAFYAEAYDPREHVLWRLHRHLADATSDLWRIYTGLDYTKPAQPATMFLSVEYLIPHSELGAIAELERLAEDFEAELETMFRPTDAEEQYAVNFDLLDQENAPSFGRVCEIQLKWLNAARDLEPYLVSVL